MATYSITLTTIQEQAIVWATNRYNAANADVEGFIPLTAPQYFMAQINRFVDSYTEHKQRLKSEALREAYVAAPEATKIQIKTLLGL